MANDTVPNPTRSDSKVERASPSTCSAASGVKVVLIIPVLKPTTSAINSRVDTTAESDKIVFRLQVLDPQFSANLDWCPSHISKILGYSLEAVRWPENARQPNKMAAGLFLDPYPTSDDFGKTMKLDGALAVGTKDDSEADILFVQAMLNYLSNLNKLLNDHNKAGQYGSDAAKKAAAAVIAARYLTAAAFGEYKRSFVPPQ
ncbi:hypothetical protein LTR62_001449 [Meristemomyces frigidus]|uniref:Uncharacterized protein n=1 Tax=Meristemomyces frigidus TaxID=1508187 RepID=A0AAN7TG48_9PEZI|nr:hypothetical protein LTR62_001449 [Meristemomyces frigidus]